MSPFRAGLPWLPALLALASCSGEPAPRFDENAREDGALELADVSRELGLADRGPDVAAVYDHLRAYGYLPNPELESAYPYWAPLVAQEARDPAVFGPVHASAVKAYQRFSGLAESGRVDKATLASFQQPRCKNPENELALYDAREKWDVAEDRLGIASTNVSWFVTSCHDNSTSFCETLKANFNAGPTGDANSIERLALNVWQNETNKTFTRLSACVEPCIPLIDVRYYSNANINPASPNFTLSLNGWPQFGSADLAQGGRGPMNNWIVAVNADASWTVDKMRSVLAHEIGHIMRFSHSAVGANAPSGGTFSAPGVAAFTRCDNVTLPCKTVAGGARSFAPGRAFRSLMFHAFESLNINGQIVDSVNNPQVLTVDDRLAAATLWGTWKQLPGLATDIGVGGDFVTTTTPATVKQPDVWVTSGSNTVWKLNSAGTAFNQDTSANANGIAISVSPSGIPWTVSSAGQVRSRSSAACTTNPCTGTWTTRGATNARDIGVGGASDTSCDDNGSHPCVWIISTVAVGSNFQVRRWNGTSFVAPGATFQGVRVAVDRDGKPLVVRADGTLFTNTSLTGANTWTQVKGTLPGPVGCATDVAAGRNGGLFITGCQTSGGNFDIWSLAINVADIFAQPGTSNRKVWWPLDGFGARVAVGPEGRAYAVQAGGGIFRRDAK